MTDRPFEEQPILVIGVAGSLIANFMPNTGEIFGK
jgi:hypothetical protein